MPAKEMSFRLPQGFSFFGGSFTSELKRVEASKDREGSPTINLHTDKENYRPGDIVTVTVEISVPESTTSHPHQLGVVCPFLVDNLSFEIKGVEKLDSQWFVIQKPKPGSKLKRGEHLFLECTTTSLISKVIVSTGSHKTYLVRAELPKILPPSYRGTTIRYIYYVKSILSGQWLSLENGHHNGGPPDNPIQVEARIPLDIWIIQKGNILLNEDGQIDEFFPAPTIQIDAFWREKNADSEWVRANDVSDGLEEGYDSSRDETSSISSYNPSKSIDISFRNSLNLQPSASRHSISEARYSQGEPSNFPSYPTLSQLSVAEVTDEPIGEILSPRKNLVSSSSVQSHSQQRTILSSPFSAEDTGGRFMQGPSEPTASEGYIRGRSYNIRIDDQVLLRFSPKNCDSTYYFGDMIGGTLTFFHGEGSRRCLELSVTLEISENISPHFVHPSRRNSPKITKVQSDHHEVVADLLQTSFLFSIPMDGPMSFSTPYISVQWALRFEFFTTPKHVDWTRYEHPLLIDEREKGDWVLPITVSAPASRSQSVPAKNQKLFSIGNLSIQT